MRRPLCRLLGRLGLNLISSNIEEAWVDALEVGDVAEIYVQ